MVHIFPRLCFRCCRSRRSWVSLDVGLAKRTYTCDVSHQLFPVATSSYTILPSMAVYGAQWFCCTIREKLLPLQMVSRSHFSASALPASYRGGKDERFGALSLRASHLAAYKSFLEFSFAPPVISWRCCGEKPLNAPEDNLRKLWWLWLPFLTSSARVDFAWGALESPAL